MRHPIFRILIFSNSLIGAIEGSVCLVKQKASALG